MMMISRTTGSNLFGLAVGSSMGMMLFSLAYHSSHVMYVTKYEVYHSNNVTSGLNTSLGSVQQTMNTNDQQIRVGEVLYFHNDTAVHRENDEIARFLHSHIRILCTVILGEEDETLLDSSRYLLGKRCNKLLYFSKFKTNSSDIIRVKVSSIGDKTISVANEAFRYLAQHHINAADWFILTDVLSYVIMENLRYFLSSVYPEDAMYFGATSNNLYGKPGFCSAYILNREGLERFAFALNISPNKPSSDPGACLLTQADERTEVLRCFKKLGFRTEETRDNLGRSRFHCFHPILEVNKVYPNWFGKTNPDYRQNTTGVSDYAITFGNVEIKRQLGLEFYVYHLGAAGIQMTREDLNI